MATYDAYRELLVNCMRGCAMIREDLVYDTFLMAVQNPAIDAQFSPELAYRLTITRTVFALMLTKFVDVDYQTLTQEQRGVFFVNILKATSVSMLRASGLSYPVQYDKEATAFNFQTGKGRSDLDFETWCIVLARMTRILESLLQVAPYDIMQRIAIGKEEPYKLEANLVLDLTMRVFYDVILLYMFDTVVSHYDNRIKVLNVLLSGDVRSDVKFAGDLAVLKNEEITSRKGGKRPSMMEPNGRGKHVRETDVPSSDAFDLMWPHHAKRREKPSRPITYEDDDDGSGRKRQFDDGYDI